ncbi:MAG: tetratricopeptide repeat protein [Desulfobulbus sp.]|jgi:tetratricopeptide (TPR) repeat protein|nr:tetratricopeptide repeat protein [Desulfobulbus sp.]
MTVRCFSIATLLFAVSLFSPTAALAGSMLTSISRSDEAPGLQLFLRFDRLPGYTTATRGRRIDLTMGDTVLADTLVLPPADGRMIKTTQRRQGAVTVLSFYFRYPPQKINLTGSKEAATLLIDIFPGNPVSAEYPELVSQLQGVSVVERTLSDKLDPRIASRYQSDWLQVFHHYESAVDIQAPPRLLLPPFPLAAALKPPLARASWLPAEITTMAESDQWNQMQQSLREHLAGQADERRKERLLLTWAEAMVRAGNFQEVRPLLRRIVIEYTGTPLADLAAFLSAFVQAVHGEHQQSFHELKGLTEKLVAATPFAGPLEMLLAELALAGNSPGEAEQLLNRETILHETSLEPLRQLRAVDLLALKKSDAALPAYRELTTRSSLIDSDPRSLAHFAGLLYQAGDYQAAAERYQQVADLVSSDRLKGLALFRQAMARLHLTATDTTMRLDLLQVQEAFPNSEGGVRARMKHTDLEYAESRMVPGEAAATYGELARTAPNVALRLEGTFKLALVTARMGDHAASVDQLMTLLREFHSGDLRTEAAALLLEQLPGLLRDLMAKKEYVRTLVLASQNRDFFARGWLDSGLLLDMAHAYAALGLTGQAAQTYQYLYEVSVEANREKIHLPLIQAQFAAGRYLQVEEFADRYLLRHPDGSDAETIFLLKVRALYESRQLDRALAVLQTKETMASPELDLLQARIHGDQRQWPQVITLLSGPKMEERLDDETTLLLAEAYFQESHNDQAATLFGELAARASSSEQVRFRLAQLELRRDSAATALNLFRKLAEEGKDPLWTRLAREEVAILQMNGP